MTNKFIEQVESIVLSNLADENFGANNLASLLGLSTSQALRKIKTSTGKSATQYIRELRLKEAAKLIEKTDLTFAEVSYKTGFGSPSYFNRMFLKQYGITPSDFKARKYTDEELAALEPNKKIFGFAKNKALLTVITILALFTAGFFIITNIQSNKNTLPNSIAVLPFKDLSPEDTQWFCDGVSDNILHSLAQVNGLTVTSFTSSATYRNSEKQIPVIAKELGVSYVLEGSVLLFEDKIKVIAQLIDANDKHVWSKEYNDSFDNVIAVQKSVAEEVMQQLQITLNLEEKIAIEKQPTKNMEAYNLHLEGRLINNSRNKDDLKKNIENNKKAIALDSNFVDAYTEVATSNMLLAITYNVSGNHKYIKEAISFVDKALGIDPRSARANAVKARIYLGNDWDQCKEYFEKTIALNPNDANSHHWYAFYFLRAEETDIKQALQHASIAIKLSPFSNVIAEQYTWTLILNGKYDEADAYMKDYSFLFSGAEQFTLKSRVMSYKTKNWDSGFFLLHDILKKEPENAFYYRWLAAGYEYLAYDESKAVFYAKKAYELDATYLNYYFYLLVNYDLSKEVDQFLQSESFNILSDYKKEYLHWLYYYNKGEYAQAHKLIKENPERFGYTIQSRTYAQLGDRKKLDSINKLYYLHGEHKYYSKALVHGILKERDSMYYYLNKSKYAMDGTAFAVCSLKDLAPYKNEMRFKAILKEYYIPYTPPTDLTYLTED